MGIILIPLLVKFNLIYRTWGFRMVQSVGPWGEQIGLLFWAGAKGSGILLGLHFPSAWRVCLRAYFLNPINNKIVVSIIQMSETQGPVPLVLAQGVERGIQVQIFVRRYY